MNSLPSSAAAFIASLKLGIWILCIPAWLFGIVERGATAIADHFLSIADVIQILIAAFFLVCWLLLKPDLKPKKHRSVTEQ
ncbi:hypothetical protein [Myxacorys almedinensis]|uniref:Uncharacterized protein n=1 Tax=Myxacorys almedinensis A TaxID=2690445 RepID=A0A8J7Z5F3_9CYAN|nr:hypothetical protein [Myxacorys almedinensis]NDJ18496.1 hypothetical protein [Myxacorys almedinensis A]